MNLSHTLIVALMFVTIISFGLVNILSSFSSVLNINSKVKASLIHLHWIGILLIVHFNLAWSAVLITSKDTWGYFEFLFLVSGPIVAFFASSVITPGVIDQDDPGAPQKQYFSIVRQFFSLFILIQLWAIGTDFLLQDDLTGSSLFNVVLIVLCVILIKIQKQSLHRYGLILAWGISLAAIILRGFDFIN
ncbi:MAG: hypothetical protein R8N23_18625 [Reichenbachiella sp.]|uniref:hypothetical protein n=1 Tax=Reichenbachiella sp. TaxID=2184521 RepID=UPI002965F920|nr:hypothetical protein [Reichenbachiella sp.]MDW3211892.1 hypothetical protein [Reichenbachiella sp.]